MAESDLSIFGPCHTYSILLDRNALASAKYHEATSQLVSLAGRQNAAGFAEAKRHCETCLAECKRTASAMRAHRTAHRC